MIMMIMARKKRFREELKPIDQGIERDYQQLIINRYTPLFERATTKVKEVMLDLGIEALTLDVHVQDDFIFNGNFCIPQVAEMSLRQVAGLYKAEHRYIANKSGRPYRGLTTQEALEEVLDLLVEQLTATVEDSVSKAID